ncbi:MAG: hypothetical protein HY295_02070 [Thaumarchaeota archaeon]|nr:hypothetical protein [Nitrososphaerota archaeon]
MADKFSKAILLLFLLIAGTLVPFVSTQAASEFITVASTQISGATILEFKNSDKSTSAIKSIILETERGGSIESFQTENSWFGKKTSADVMTFTSTDSLKAGQSIKFTIKTSQPNAVFKWKALDEKGVELGSGSSIAQSSSEGSTTPQGGTSKENNNVEQSQPISEKSVFKLIPSTPRVGASMRVVGEGFGPNEKLDFYIGSNKITSFVSSNKGNFVVTAKVPENQQPDRTDFVVKDTLGNQKVMSLRIQESMARIAPAQNVKLTVNADNIYHRGDTKTISGTGPPETTLTISIEDQNGKSITTSAVKTDSSGAYSLSHVVPIDRALGDYLIKVTDGKNVVIHPYKVETTSKITLAPLKEKYEAGETVIINGTAIPNQNIQFVIKEPTGLELYTKQIQVGNDGKVYFEYKLDIAAKKGTYIVGVTQQSEETVVLFGVGSVPQPRLIIKMNQVNYKTSEQAIIDIRGQPSSKVSLIIIDPSDKQKFADTIIIGLDGLYSYTLKVDGYSPGVYSAVITRGNEKVETKFSVGLQTGSGSITIKTIKDAFLPGDPILLLGETSPNSILTITLKDPNGNKIKSIDVLSDKKGIFSSTVFRFPGDAQQGVWVIEAQSGVNHVTKELTVKTKEENMTIVLDKNPPEYRVGDIVNIGGSGAGQSSNLIITILGSEKTEIERLGITSTSRGDYDTVWQVPPNFSPGTYTIHVQAPTKTVETTFTVK